MTNLLILLQQQLTAEQLQQRRDSIRLGAQMMVEHAKNDPQSFWTEVGQTMLHFGLKVLAALALFVVGWWLIGVGHVHNKDY